MFQFDRVKFSKLSLPAGITGLLALALFWEPATSLVADWWTDPEAGHGLLLAPLSIYLAWRGGLISNRAAQPALGISILLAAVLLRFASGLAAELFTMRASLLAAGVGFVVHLWGTRQLVHWWLPLGLFTLSIPIPTVVLNSIALPLQLQASEIGAALLTWRQVPVALQGNVILLPGQSLFVTEACSGLRSLTALLSLGLLVGGLSLRTITGRTFLVLSAVPVAIMLNGVRVFLTGFLVFFVGPEFGEGFMHYSEGWVTFVIALGILAGMTVVVGAAERKLAPA